MRFTCRLISLHFCLMLFWVPSWVLFVPLPISAGESSQTVRLFGPKSAFGSDTFAHLSAPTPSDFKRAIVSDWITIELKKLRVSTRFRLQDNDRGVRTKESLQYAGDFDVTVYLGKDQNMWFEIGGRSGSSFQSGWNDTPFGRTSKTATDFNVVWLSYHAKIFNSGEVSVGSLKPDYGYGDENSSFDKDGYIVGYRAKVHMGQDRIVVTGGFVGDFNNPSSFDRFHRLADFNYWAVAYHKHLTELLAGSFEFFQLKGNSYLREVIEIKVPWVSFIEKVLLQDLFSPERSSNSFTATLKAKIPLGWLGSTEPMDAALSYTTSASDMGLLMGDKLFAGHATRGVLEKDIWRSDWMSVGLFIDLIRSLDSKASRYEMGLTLRY